MEKNSKIYVAGHNGLVGSAIVRKLKSNGFNNLLLKSSKELDLKNQSAVEEFFAKEKPEYVFLAAAKVGGIQANEDFPADFIYDNVMIEMNVIFSSFSHKVKKLLFLGSSCIYPKYAKQPIKEEYLLDGKLEPTNEFYAIAKICGLKMCEAFNRQHKTNFISLMPTNLYGPNDNFDLNTSHVLPALIRKFHEAKVSSSKEVVLWGTGKPKREFLHVDDLAAACLFLMDTYNESGVINVGCGSDISINDLAELVKKVTDFRGKIVYDSSKPDGTPRKLLDTSKITSLGWKPTVPLEQGLLETYKTYKDIKNSLL